MGRQAAGCQRPAQRPSNVRLARALSHRRAHASPAHAPYPYFPFHALIRFRLRLVPGALPRVIPGSRRQRGICFSHHPCISPPWETAHRRTTSRYSTSKVMREHENQIPCPAGGCSCGVPVGRGYCLCCACPEFIFQQHGSSRAD